MESSQPDWKVHRLYKRKEKYRAYQHENGTWKVRGDWKDSAIITYTDEEFKANFDLTSQTLVCVDAQNKTYHYV